jgi:Ca2+-binding EF-hand superfamily protein
MKLQYLTLCALISAPLAFGEGDKNQIQHQKQFGTDTNLPAYLEHYDVDGNCVIDEEERQVMEQARDQIRKQLREDWDVDGDGKLCEQEREHARQRLRDMMDEKREERFNEADTNGDGIISKEEFETLPGIADKLPEMQDIVDAIFARLDTDGVEGISLDEFLAAVGGQGGDGGTGDGPVGPGDGDCPS